MTNKIIFLLFLVGSALAADSGKERALVEKKRTQNNSETGSEYFGSAVSKKPRFLDFDSIEDRTVKVSLFHLGSAKIIPEPESSDLIESHSLQPKKEQEQQQESVKVSPVSPKLAKWRKEFFSAIQANDSRRLESLQAELDDANFRIYSPRNPKNFTFPLHFALRHDLKDAVSFLLEGGLFDPKAKDFYGHTALSLTIELGDYRSFSDLLEVSDVHELVRDGLNLTHLAASMNTISPIFLKALQNKQVDFTARCRKLNWTPLQYAVAANNQVLAFWLNENTPCNFKHGDNATIVLDALMEGHEDLAIKLLEKGANFAALDKNGRNIFHLAAEKNCSKILAYVEDTPVEIFGMLIRFDKIKGYCPAHYAAEKNNYKILRWFHQEEDLDLTTIDGLSVIQVAINAGSTEVVQLMLDEKLFDWTDSFGSESPPILVMAYKTGHIEVVKAILDCVSDDFYYLFDEKGLNVLHYAVIENDLPFVETLITKYDFNPFHLENGTDEVPANSPFAWAIFKNNANIVELFLKYRGLQSESLRFSLFSFDELPVTVDADDEEDCTEIEQLISIFGDEKIKSLIEKYKRN